MQDVFTLVGMISALLIGLGVLLFFASWVMQVRNESYYRGLRDQLNEAIAGIGDAYRAGEPISAGSVRFLLRQLHNRRTPSIADMKANDLIRLDSRALCGPHLEELLEWHGSPLTAEQREIIRQKMLGAE